MPELNGSMWRSYENMQQCGTGNPYKLLCSAIVFQAAVDCEAIKRYGEGTFALSRYAKDCNKEMTRKAMTNFINSDWLEFLLCWTDCVKLDAVRENLIERLGTDETVPK